MRGWLALLACVVVASASDAQPRGQRASSPDAVRVVTPDSSGYGGQLALPIGGSKILRFREPIGRVLLGEPKVADVVPLSDRTLYVLGKAEGATNLTVMRGEGGNPIATLDVRVGYDLDAMGRAFSELMPGEPIQVSARGGAVVLSGVVSSSVVATRAQALAETYAPEKVVNLMSVRAAEQVMLSVHVAEVQRSMIKQLGITGMNELIDETGQIILNPDLLTFNPDAFLNLFSRTQETLSNGTTITVDQLFNALERKGYASTLARPKLTALSGETAVFFAGGEFPIPVPQNIGGTSPQITIEFKQFGVSVGFTPTVYGDTINLVVAPEVSALDQQNAVVLQGFRIPGITTRRARTTIELKNGQSFAIGGLIRRDFADSLRGQPGIMDIPIIGALFRSTQFQNNETEVVIIVTAHLAKPTTRENLLLPTDTRRAPSEIEYFLTPRTDKPIPNATPKAPGATQ